MQIGARTAGRTPSRWALTLGCLALGCSRETMDIPVDRLPAPETALVILVLDGVSLDDSLGSGSSSVNGEATENFLPAFREQILDEGAVVTQGLHVGVTITTEAHVELLTGRRQPLATFERAMTDTYRSDVPTLFELVRQDRGLIRSQAAVYTNSVVVEDTTWSLYPTHRGLYAPTYVHEATTTVGGLDEAMDADLLEQVQVHMEETPTHMVLVNLHGMDLAGHMGEGTAYLDMVRKIDQPLVDFFSFIEESSIYGGKTMVAVVADHGRHQWGEEEDWRNHGDQCLGCRKIPLFLWAPGAVKASVLDEVVTLSDLSQTFAAWMGVELDLGHGRFIDSVFEEPPDGRSTRGDGAVSASGGMVIVQRWEDGRSQVFDATNSVEVSGADAFVAEAPRVAATESMQAVCWRALPEIELSTETYWKWEPHCAVRTSEMAWTEIGFPDEAVSAYWAPAMTIDADNRLWVVSDDNPNGYAGKADVRPLLAQWQLETGWTSEANSSDEKSMPTDSTVLRLEPDSTEAELLVAMAFSTDHDQGRDTRSIGVDRVEVSEEGDQTWTEVLRLEPSSEVERRERAVLGMLDETVGLAHLGYDAKGVVMVQVAVSDDRGDTWSELVTLEQSGKVFGHIRPVWGAEGQLSWARLNGAVEICTASGVLDDPTAAHTSCQALDSKVIDALAADDTGLWVSVLTEDGVFETMMLGG